MAPSLGAQRGLRESGDPVEPREQQASHTLWEVSVSGNRSTLMAPSDWAEEVTVEVWGGSWEGLARDRVPLFPPRLDLHGAEASAVRVMKRSDTTPPQAQAVEFKWLVGKETD